MSMAITQALLRLIYLPWPTEMPKVAKAGTIVAVACRCRWRYRIKLNANVNYPI